MGLVLGNSEQPDAEEGGICGIKRVGDMPPLWEDVIGFSE